MAPILISLISSGSKKKEPRCVCLSDYKASLRLKILITSSFGFPSKGALPQGPLHGIPRRDTTYAPPLEPSFIHPSKSPVYDPPHIPGSPRMERGPHGERCPYPETFLAYLPGSTVKEPPQSPFPRRLFREKLHFLHHDNHGCFKSNRFFRLNSHRNLIFCDLRLPPRWKWDLCFSGALRSVYW